ERQFSVSFASGDARSRKDSGVTAQLEQIRVAHYIPWFMLCRQPDKSTQWRRNRYSTFSPEL
ncbi:hypothetical protein, partial [Candidatus Hakubella thermalkaliphila]|uniref:hypothetical protein n=1 Tax=Candidatus Hakubella thermalkaliphila TaxID=2754717 RepID=UPI001C6124DD